MVKQTLKSKKACLRSEASISRIYSLTCPHCNVTLKGGFDEYVLMIRCKHCGGIIDLRDDESGRYHLKKLGEKFPGALGA